MVVTEKQKAYLYVECKEYGIPYNPEHYTCRICDTLHKEGCAYVPDEYTWKRNPCPNGTNNCRLCKHGRMTGYGSAYKCRHPQAWKMKKVVARGKVKIIKSRAGKPKTTVQVYKDIDMGEL